MTWLPLTFRGLFRAVLVRIPDEKPRPVRSGPAVIPRVLSAHKIRSY